MTDPQRPITEDNPIGIDRVRQGVVSYRVIWVLGIGTALAVLAMVVLWLGIGGGSQGGKDRGGAPAVHSGLK
jgi:hypothetical protein